MINKVIKNILKKLIASVVTGIFLSNAIFPDISLAEILPIKRLDLRVPTVMENPVRKREIVASLYRKSRLIWVADSSKYLGLLAQNNAIALLLPSGRYLMTPDTARNDLSLIRSCSHEDIEILMQQEERLRPDRYQKLKKRVLKNKAIIGLYYKISGYKNGDSKKPDNIIFNDLIAMAFELIFIIDNHLAYPDKELTKEERKFVKLIRPVLEAKDTLGRYKNFSQIFFDFNKRIKAVQALQMKDKGRNFYRATRPNISIAELIQKLRHYDKEVRDYALEELRIRNELTPELEAKKYTADLRNEARDFNKAINELGRIGIGTNEAISELRNIIRMHSGFQGWVQVLAINSLSSIAIKDKKTAPTIIPMLIEYIGDYNDYYREDEVYAAMSGLSAIAPDNEDIIKFFIEKATRKYLSGKSRQVAVSYLRKIKPRTGQITLALKKILELGGKDAREEAKNTLAEHGELSDADMARYYIAELRDHETGSLEYQEIINRLTDSTNKGFIPILQTAVEDREDNSVRNGAWEALLKLGRLTPELKAKKFIADIKHSHSYDICEHAINELAKLGMVSDEVIPELRGVAANHKNYRDELRIAAVEALAKIAMDDKKTVSIIKPILKQYIAYSYAEDGGLGFRKPALVALIAIAPNDTDLIRHSREMFNVYWISYEEKLIALRYLAKNNSEQSIKVLEDLLVSHLLNADDRKAVLDVLIANGLFTNTRKAAYYITELRYCETDSPKRAEAIDELKKIGGDAMPVIEKTIALKSEHAYNGRFKEDLCIALSGIAIDSEKAFPALVPIFVRELNRDGNPVSKPAESALNALEIRYDYIYSFIKMLDESEDDSARAAIAKSLGNMHPMRDDAIIALARALIRDKQENVRMIAMISFIAALSNHKITRETFNSILQYKPPLRVLLTLQRNNPGFFEGKPLGRLLSLINRSIDATPDDNILPLLNQFEDSIANYMKNIAIAGEEDIQREYDQIASLLNIVHDNLPLCLSSLTNIGLTIDNIHKLIEVLPINNPLTRIIRMLGEGRAIAGGYQDTVLHLININRFDRLYAFILQIAKDQQRSAPAEIEGVLAILTEYKNAGIGILERMGTLEWEYFFKEIEAYHSTIPGIISLKLFIFFTQNQTNKSIIAGFKRDVEKELSDSGNGSFFGLSDGFKRRYNLSDEDEVALISRHFNIANFSLPDYTKAYCDVRKALREIGIGNWQGDVPTEMRTLFTVKGSRSFVVYREGDRGTLIALSKRLSHYIHSEIPAITLKTLYANLIDSPVDIQRWMIGLALSGRGEKEKGYFSNFPENPDDQREWLSKWHTLLADTLKIDYKPKLEEKIRGFIANDSSLDIAGLEDYLTRMGFAWIDLEEEDEFPRPDDKIIESINKKRYEEFSSAVSDKWLVLMRLKQLKDEQLVNQWIERCFNKFIKRVEAKLNHSLAAKEKTDIREAISSARINYCAKETDIATLRRKQLGSMLLTAILRLFVNDIKEIDSQINYFKEIAIESDDRLYVGFFDDLMHLAGEFIATGVCTWKDRARQVRDGGKEGLHFGIIALKDSFGKIIGFSQVQLLTTAVQGKPGKSGKKYSTISLTGINLYEGSLPIGRKQAVMAIIKAAYLLKEQAGLNDAVVVFNDEIHSNQAEVKTIIKALESAGTLKKSKLTAKITLSIKPDYSYDNVYVIQDMPDITLTTDNLNKTPVGEERAVFSDGFGEIRYNGYDPAENAPVFRKMVETVIQEMPPEIISDVRIFLDMNDIKFRIAADAKVEKSTVSRKEKEVIVTIGKDILYDTGKIESLGLRQILAEAITSILLKDYTTVKEQALFNENAYFKLALIKALLNYKMYIPMYHKIVCRYNWNPGSYWDGKTQAEQAQLIEKYEVDLDKHTRGITIELFMHALAKRIGEPEFKELVRGVDIASFKSTKDLKDALIEKAQDSDPENKALIEGIAITNPLQEIAQWKLFLSVMDDADPDFMVTNYLHMLFKQYFIAEEDIRGLATRISQVDISDKPSLTMLRNCVKELILDGKVTLKTREGNIQKEKFDNFDNTADIAKLKETLFTTKNMDVFYKALRKLINTLLPLSSKELDIEMSQLFENDIFHAKDVKQSIKKALREILTRKIGATAVKDIEDHLKATRGYRFIRYIRICAKDLNPGDDADSYMFLEERSGHNSDWVKDLFAVPQSEPGKEEDGNLSAESDSRPPIGAPATLLRYMFEHKITKNNPVMPKDLARKRGGNDSLSNIYRELIPLEKAGIVQGAKGQPRYLADWVLAVDPEEIIRQNPELNQPALYMRDMPKRGSFSSAL